MATCWDITRTDGVVLGFTDHDQDLVLSGVTYKAATGYARTALKSDQTLAVNNIDVIGILDSAEITEVDLEGGRYDWATFHIFAVNWMDLTQDRVRLCSGTFGEVQALPTGTYKVELRGLTQYLTAETCNNYQPLCRADLGDSKCKVPIKPTAWTAITSVTAGVSGVPYGAFGGGPTLLVDGSYVSDPSPVDDTHALAVYQCTTAGMTGTAAPSFNPTVGATTADGSAVWTSITPWRGVGTVSSVTNNGNFVTSALTLNPFSNNAPASVQFNGFASIGLSITVTIGVNTRTYDIMDLRNPTNSVEALADAINTDHAASLIAATASYFFGRDNVSAVVINKVNPNDTGLITKAHDVANNVIVSQGGWAYTGGAYLTGGLITWLTGANAGLSMEIKSFDSTSNIMQLFLSMGFVVAPGDKFYFQPGCDKSRLSCFTKFNNILNFRGEPDVPGMDQYMAYPDANT